MNVRTPSRTAIPARTWKIAAVAGAGAFMAMLDATVANLALEAIRSDFQTTLPRVQWIITAYLVALAVSLPATAWLGNRHGHGRVWFGALGLFVASSALCALATGPLTLIAARVLQGLAAGVMVPAGQAVIAATAGRDQLGRIFGVLGLVIALGPAVGPAIGGVLLETASWRWLFWINLPVGVAALLAARGVVPPGMRDRERPLDVRGLLLLGAGLPLLLYGAMRAGSAQAGGAALVTVMAGAALIAGFVFSALGRRAPLVDLRLLRDRRFSAATLVTGGTGANLFGGLLLLPLYLQAETARDAAETGAMLLLMGVGSALALPVAGTLTDRHGARNVVLAGGALLVLGTLPFLLPMPMSDAVLGTLLLTRGIGLALAQMPAMTAAYTAVAPGKAGDAATLVNIVQRVGGAAGAVTLVVVLAQAGDGGFGDAFVALTLIGVLTLLPAALLRSGSARA